MAAFRDLAARFADASAQVLGISMDDLTTQKRFADSLKLPFPLLADPEGKAAGAYGVARVFEKPGEPPVRYAERVTFVIDRSGRVLKVLEGKEAIDPAPALAACPLHGGK